MVVCRSMGVLVYLIGWFWICIEFSEDLLGLFLIGYYTSSMVLPQVCPCYVCTIFVFKGMCSYIMCQYNDLKAWYLSCEWFYIDLVSHNHYILPYKVTSIKDYSEHSAYTSTCFQCSSHVGWIGGCCNFYFYFQKLFEEKNQFRWSSDKKLLDFLAACWVLEFRMPYTPFSFSEKLSNFILFLGWMIQSEVFTFRSLTFWRMQHVPLGMLTGWFQILILFRITNFQYFKKIWHIN